MKIAVIATAYLESFVGQALEEMRLPCETQFYAYHSFSQISELYLSLEEEYDGFIVSGIVPKHAIFKGVPACKKPIEDFGTDLQSYYELFLRLIYGEGADLTRGYFDLLDWLPDAKPMTTYLAQGSFATFYQRVNDYLDNMSRTEIAQREQEVLQKHLRLYRQGLVDFTVTRFSSIAGALQEAGVNFHFVYPHVQVIRDAFDRLIARIRLQNMRVNQTSAIYVTPRQGGEAVPEAGRREMLLALEDLLKKFNKERMGDFTVGRTGGGCEVFTSYRFMREITDGFTACPLKEYVERRADFKACVGYGVGSTHTQALANAKAANVEANINSGNHSFLVNEKGELVGPLDKRPLVLSNRATPYVQNISARAGLSTLTVQKILSVMGARGTDELSPQDLAKELSITVRSANRFIKQLVESDLAVVQYERQNASRGRPERVYRLLLNPRESAGA